MNKFVFVLVILLLLFSFFVVAQIDQDTVDKSGSGFKCGKGVRQSYAACDLSSNASDNDLCPEIGKILGITMVCNPASCECFQPKKTITCGDKHTDGTEICDPPGKDFCPQVGALMNISLECDPSTCSCKAPLSSFVSAVPDVTNVTKSLCGNHQLDAGEECDPPGRMCSFGGIVGICSADCKCKEVPSDEFNTTVETNASNNNLAENAASAMNKSEQNLSQTGESQIAASPGLKQTSDFVDKKESGVSDETYTIVLIILVVVFIIGLGVGSYFIYKRSQISNFGEQSFEQKSEVGKDKKQD